jgi:cell division protein ZapA (FtsZ GTPase activity inhibitor)
METQSVKVSIFGKTYMVSSSNDESVAFQAARMVDELMHAATRKGAEIPESKAAVYTSLQLAFEILKMRQDQELFHRKIASLLDVLDTA